MNLYCRSCFEMSNEADCTEHPSRLGLIYTFFSGHADAIRMYANHEVSYTLPSPTHETQTEGDVVLYSSIFGYVAEQCFVSSSGPAVIRGAYHEMRGIAMATQCPRPVGRETTRITLSQRDTVLVGYSKGFEVRREVLAYSSGE